MDAHTWDVIQTVGANVFELFEGSFTVLATALAGIVLHKIAVKLHLQNEAELKNGLDFVITRAVHGAEGWADAHEVPPEGSDKMSEAIKIARMFLATPAFKGLTDDSLKRLIEAKLSMESNLVSSNAVAKLPINNPTVIAKALKEELAK